MKKAKAVCLTIVIVLMMLLSACGANSKKHHLTIWSFYPNRDLDVVIRNYMDVHPDIEVIHTGFNFPALPGEFRKRAAQGLGPDAVIVTERELPRLIKLGLIAPLEKYHIDTSKFDSKTLVSLRDSHGQLYGMPVAHQVMGLCYNRELVSQPPKTLSEWLDQARSGIP
ncbi:hypothetical protein Xen7305DRAFT_00050630 [Xenococcus sp. PCC 7305]|uniref:ABC transporter substrate-binding protein n=1 Tax=Xenococcus sp. PCC 7305 TaxID=102125 RepID=UPI0002AC7E0E|nr:extracellular solute-binding protein [Xenococcus sp. PCC 7305]ELS05320.1 hypothetical protein Xen7305DRAFT_00050630 [Xenococcus sp. PCC 7305]